ncbi:MAG: WYL domain-containing transcriptional regulator [Chloroflexota bacterium]
MGGKRAGVDRVGQIEALLWTHPEGLTQAEIARRLGVHRSTVLRCLPKLEGRCLVYEEVDGRLRIDRERQQVRLQLTLHEAMAVHLATRLLATRSDKHNPHSASALRKLGLALARLAPRISRHLLQSAEVMDASGLRQDPRYLDVLEKLTVAWAEERKVRVWHRHAESGEVRDFKLAPYFIEPYAVGQTAHVIGWREPPGALRTLKVERIERAEPLSEPYVIPEDFDPRELLAEAWGIWYTEAEPVEVVLRFHPRVARRAAETEWHRSQQIEELPDGSLLWRVRVAEPQEMMPWIRGWGADVEVLGPEGLRESMRLEAERLGRLYLVEEAG